MSKRIYRIKYTGKVENNFNAYIYVTTLVILLELETLKSGILEENFPELKKYISLSIYKACKVLRSKHETHKTHMIKMLNYKEKGRI